MIVIVLSTMVIQVFADNAYVHEWGTPPWTTISNNDTDNYLRADPFNWWYNGYENNYTLVISTEKLIEFITYINNQGSDFSNNTIQIPYIKNGDKDQLIQPVSGSTYITFISSEWAIEIKTNNTGDGTLYYGGYYDPQVLISQLQTIKYILLPYNMNTGNKYYGGEYFPYIDTYETEYLQGEHQFIQIWNNAQQSAVYDEATSEGSQIATTWFNQGYNIGYQDGQRHASDIGQAGTQLIYATVEAPVNVFKSLLNFEILGVNVLGFVTACLSIMLVVAIIKRFV